MSAWRRLDPDATSDLSEARTELAWALLLPASAGASLLTPRANDAHVTLAWSSRQEALLGCSLGAGGVCVGVRPRDLALVMIVGGELVAERPLVGRTFAHGLRWLAAALDPLGEGLPAPLAPPSFSLPDHPVSRGEAFSAGDGAALLALGDWIADAQLALDALRSDAEASGGSASEARLHPARLEHATRIVGPDGAVIEAGLALAPAPAYFVRPEAPTPRDALPELPAGARWRGAEAVLPGEALDPDARVQREQTLAFFGAALRAIG